MLLCKKYGASTRDRTIEIKIVKKTDKLQTPSVRQRHETVEGDGTK